MEDTVPTEEYAMMLHHNLDNDTYLYLMSFNL